MCLTVLKGQDYKADVEQALCVYKDDVYAVEAEYLFFTSHTAVDYSERHILSIKKSGNQLRINQFGVEIIYTNQYMLMLDRVGKVIALDSRIKPEANNTKNTLDGELVGQFAEALEEWSKQLNMDAPNEDDMYQVSYMGIKKGKKIYKVEYKYGEHEKIIIHINEKTNQIEKQILFYRDPVQTEEGVFSKVRVEVNILKQTSGTEVNKDTFDITNYVSIQKDGTAKLLGKYHDFYLINHLAEATY